MFLKLAFQGGGSLSAYYGSAGVVAMIATFDVLVIAAKSLREEDSFQLFPRLGLGLTLDVYKRQFDFCEYFQGKKGRQ